MDAEIIPINRQALRAEKKIISRALTKILDPENPPFTTAKSGEITVYDHLAAAWQDNNGNAYVVYKSAFIDHRQPKDWLVLYYDSMAGVVEVQEVEHVDVIDYEDFTHIHFFMRHNTSRNHHGSYVIEFGVNDEYEASRPLVVLDNMPPKRNTFAHRIEMLHVEPEFDDSTPPLIGKIALL